MTNYRRLISYIYAYEGEAKGKNIGFAKLESRNGQCKLSVNVKKVYVGSSDLGVYLLAPGREIFLGSIFIRGGSGEFRAAVAVDNAADSGCSMDQCYGLTIHEKGDTWRAYTTIWEDAVAHAAELELAGVTSESRGNAHEQIHKKIEELDRELEAQENNSGKVSMAEPDIEPEIIDIPVDPEVEEPGEDKPAVEEPDMKGAEESLDTSLQPRGNGHAGSEASPTDFQEQWQARETEAEKASQAGEAESGRGTDWTEEAIRLERYAQENIRAAARIEAQTGLDICPKAQNRGESGRAQGTQAGDRRTLEELEVERQWNQGANEEIQSAQEAVLKEDPDKVEPLGSSTADEAAPNPGIPEDSQWPYAAGMGGTPEGTRKTSQAPGAIPRRQWGTAPVTRMPLPFGAARPVNRAPLSPMTSAHGGIRPAQVARMTPAPGAGRTAGEPLASDMSASLGTGGLAEKTTVPGMTPSPETGSVAEETPAAGAASTGISPGDGMVSSSPASPASPSAENPHQEQPPVVDTGEPALPLGDPEELARLEEEEQEHYQPQQLWEEFRKRYPKIQAFDSANGCEILTIKPQDIGLLPRENWNYGNNSFLLHGYYNYRYLVLARIGGDGGSRIRYILGVPGHYYSNEKYMASMFGFPHFVLSKKQPSQDGRFGYWYTDIRLQNQD